MARKLINRLKPLGDQFLEWGKGETEDQIDGAADAQLAADISRETWRLATEYATDIDVTVKQPAESLRNWDGTLRTTERTVHKLLWILDGWEQVVKLWDQASHRPREEQRSMLRDVVRHLPVVPATNCRPPARTCGRAWSTASASRSGRSPVKAR